MYDYKDKRINVLNMNTQMLNKTLGMFEYDGLPESIPSVEIERRLQTKGYVFIYEVDGVLYALDGSMSGELDVYGHHLEITLNNTFLNLHKTVKIDDGVLIKNDDFNVGLIPLYDKYHSILNENEITMMMNNFSNRMQRFISAGDDKTKTSAEIFIQNIIKGELGVIAESQIFDGLRNNNNSVNGVSSLDLIEFQQYMKASLYNEIGIDLNFNMKRERLTSGEVQQNSEFLYPLVNSMYRNRVTGIDLLNAKYELDVQVHYGSIWKEREIIETEESEESEESEETEETEETRLSLDEITDEMIEREKAFYDGMGDKI